jgi:Cd2+/Zn2+-exporting ATPase
MDEQTEELSVSNVHCASCADDLQESVGRLNGVSQVNFAAGKLRVRYDAQKLGRDELVQHVERIGYTVHQGHTLQVDPPSLWRSRRVVLTVISGVLIGVGLVLELIRLDRALLTVGGRSLSLAVLFYLTAAGVGGAQFARQGWQALLARQLNISFLMSIAVVGAMLIGEYIEGASLAFLFALAEFLEGYSVERARRSLRELMKLVPNEARTHRDGREVMLPIEQIRVGEVITVKPGERIALDGEVTVGHSTVNQAPITGESVPVEKRVGSFVFAGTINHEGYLEIKVTKGARDTTLAKIIHLVEEAEAQRAPSERFVDRFARYYTPGVVAVAVGVALGPPVLWGAPFSEWFARALVLLVIACPCALVISTPVSIVSAITSAARHGVLIKGGAYLEELGQIKAIVFDKTGTLTTGQLAVTDVIAFPGHTAEEILQIAASLESKSQHPIAQAIVQYYEQTADRTSLLKAHRVQSLTGQGLRAQIGSQVYLVGKPELFPQTEELPQLAQLQSQAKTVVLVGTEHQAFGIIAVVDQIRSEALETIARLKELGLKVAMLTGDNEGTAQAVARQVGIADYRAGVLPESKAVVIARLLKKHGKVAMIGDGVNDAPALATATVGIAMGAAGTDTALETAHVALMADDLGKLPYLVELSRRARRIIQQNIWFSVLTKFSLGAGVFPGYVTLVLAVLAGDMGASLAVTGNALRLAQTKPRASAG